MSRRTLDDEQSSQYGKEVVIGPAKMGKTVTILSNLLGIFPWHEYGGVVSKPENLHVFTFDAATLDGFKQFALNVLKAPKEVGKVDVHNLQNDVSKAFTTQDGYSPVFMSTLYDHLNKVLDSVGKGGVHAIVFASLTMCAKAVLRSISGPAFGFDRSGAMLKSPMDQNKWGLFAQQMTELQFAVQGDTHHTIWETHWAERESKKEKDGAGNAKVYDSIQVQGSTAVQFPAQCERPYMLKRIKGGYKPGSKVDIVEWDTQPDLDFGASVTSGRKVIGVLEPKERELALMFSKLGLKVGGWGA